MCSHRNDATSTEVDSKRRPRFGLKLLFVLLTAVATGVAWLCQPQATYSVTVDLAKYEEYQQAGGGIAALRGLAVAANDHCIRIRSSRIISDVMAASTQLTSLAERQSKRPLNWIYDRVEVVPAGGDKVRINVVGNASDKKELQHLANALAEHYLEFLGEVVDVSTGETTEAGEITQRVTGWTVRWR